MAQFSMSGSQDLTPANWDKMLKENSLAHEQADFDTGWITVPASKIITHNLGVVPSEVWVYSSASPDGDPHSPDTWTNNGRSTITVNGAQPFTRVRINKGSS